MSIIRDVAVSLACVILTIVFDVITLAVTDRARLDAGPDAVLAVQFDLLLIALSILFGAHVNAPDEKRGRLNLPFLITTIAIILCLASVALSAVAWTQRMSQVWLTTWIPDVVALAALGFATHAAWETR
jgi:hypothetical protein